jgi:hypothetical protein
MKIQSSFDGFESRCPGKNQWIQDFEILIRRKRGEKENDSDEKKIGYID